MRVNRFEVAASAQAAIIARENGSIMRSRNPKVLAWQSCALAALCCADLVSTIWLCRVHGADEANPLMAYFLAQGVLVFAAAKLVLTALPITVLEWARRIRPSVAVIGLNTALLGYITLYGAGLAHINRKPSIEEAARLINTNPRYVTLLAENRRRVAAKRNEMLAAGKQLVAPQVENSPLVSKALPSASITGNEKTTAPCEALN